MVEKRKAILAGIVFVVLIFFSIDAAYAAMATFSNIQPNTLYKMTFPVSRSDGLDVWLRYIPYEGATFLSNAPVSYFWTTGRGSDGKATFYFMFSGSTNNNLRIDTEFSTAYQTQNSTPAYTTSANVNVFTPNGVVLKGCFNAAGQSAYLYSGSNYWQLYLVFLHEPSTGVYAWSMEFREGGTLKGSVSTLGGPWPCFELYRYSSNEFRLVTPVGTRIFTTSLPYTTTHYATGTFNSLESLATTLDPYNVPQPTINSFVVNTSTMPIQISYSVSNANHVAILYQKSPYDTSSSTFHMLSSNSSITYDKIRLSVRLEAWNGAKVSTSTVLLNLTPQILNFSASLVPGGVSISAQLRNSTAANIYVNGVLVRTINNTNYDLIWTIPATTITCDINSHPINVTIVAVNEFYTAVVAQQSVVLHDTQPPTITSFTVNLNQSGLNVAFTAQDNVKIKKYVLMAGTQMLESVTTNAVTLSFSKTYPVTILPSIVSTTGDFYISLYVYDLAGLTNSKSIDGNSITVPMTIQLVNEHTNANLNLSHFQSVYLYSKLDGTNTPITSATLSISPKLGDTLRIYFIYKNYPDYFYVELKPWFALFFTPKIAIPGLINNTTIPYLYEFLALSAEDRPIILTRADTGTIKLASSTQYPYDRYKSNSAFLLRTIYNVYTIENDQVVFLSAIDGGRAQAVSLDALRAAIKPVQGIYPGVLDVEWLSNSSLRIAYRTLDLNTKNIAIDIYVNGTLLTTISSNTSVLNGVVDFSGYNITVTNNTTIKIVASKDGKVTQVREFLGFSEKRFELPYLLVVGLSLSMLLFGLFMLGSIETTRYWGLVICFAVLAITTISPVQDAIIRVIQVACLILIVVFIASRLRGGG